MTETQETNDETQTGETSEMETIDTFTCAEQMAALLPEVTRLLGPLWECKVLYPCDAMGVRIAGRTPTMGIRRTTDPAYEVRFTMHSKPYPHLSLYMEAFWTTGYEGRMAASGGQPIAPKVALRWASGQASGYSWRRASGYMLRGVTAAQVADALRKRVIPAADAAVARHEENKAHQAQVAAAEQPIRDAFAALARRIGGVADTEYWHNGLRWKPAPVGGSYGQVPLEMHVSGLVPDVGHPKPAATLHLHDLSPELALRIAELVMREQMQTFADANLAAAQASGAAPTGEEGA